MTVPDQRGPWVKSSYSASAENCVEVAGAPADVLVRDSKQDGHGPILRFGRAQWTTLLRRVGE